MGIKTDDPATPPLTVKQFLDRYGHSALTIRESDTVVEASTHFADTVAGHKYSMAVVLDDDDRVVGVVSLGDIVHAVHKYREKLFEMRVRDIMSTRLYAARLTDNIFALLKRMADAEIRHMPVVEDGKLAGLVTRKDALEGLYDDAALELKSLTEFVFRSGARY